MFRKTDFINLDLNNDLKDRVFLKQFFVSENKKPQKVWSSWNFEKSSNKHQKHFGTLKEIKQNSIVLDLMSSWDSYLPKRKKYKKVNGHGLNSKELEKNKILDSFWTQNLNLNQNIPMNDGSVDYCLMVAAWQYLQYPEKLTQEISRILCN